MPRRRKTTYGASLVSIVAAFSAGCENETAAPLDCSDLPADGTECSGSTVCTYSCHSYPHLSGTVSCKDGRVESYLGTCNPPAPDSGWRDQIDGGSIDCQRPPEVGALCSGSEVLCTFTCNSPTGYPNTLRCVDGRVERQRLPYACNPPFVIEDDAGPFDGGEPADASGFDAGS